jgi:hypothetical protein
MKTGKELKVTSNTKERTFRIKKDNTIFKTIKMTKDDFNDADNWTANDWQSFLNKTHEYFIIK